MKSCIINYDESHYKSGQFFSELFPAKNANAKITMDTIVNNKYYTLLSAMPLLASPAL